MKQNHFIILTATAFLAAFTAVAEEVPVSPEPAASLPQAAGSSLDSVSSRNIDLLPSHKRSLALKADERNPYARRTPEIEIEENEGGEETESDRIRKVLTGLAVTGRSYGPKGLRILAGDIIFERGRVVPPVLEDQTESMIVEHVDDEGVTLAWIDIDSGQQTGKRLKLSYDLSPTVGYVLHGQAAGGEENTERKFGVLARDQLMHAGSPARSPASHIAAEADPFNEVLEDETLNDVAAEILRQGQ